MARGGNCPQHFSREKISIWSENFFPKNTQFGAEKSPFWGKFRSTVEILSSHNLPCWKFAAVRRKTATSCPYFLNPGRFRGGLSQSRGLSLLAPLYFNQWTVLVDNRNCDACWYIDLRSTCVHMRCLCCYMAQTCMPAIAITFSQHYHYITIVIQRPMQGTKSSRCRTGDSHASGQRHVTVTMTSRTMTSRRAIDDVPDVTMISNSSNYCSMESKANHRHWPRSQC